MNSIEYLTDINGNKKAVVIPIEIWEKIKPNNLGYIITEQPQKIAKAGLHLGAISMADDFDESLPDSLARGRMMKLLLDTHIFIW